jgi:hypothetical protein
MIYRNFNHWYSTSKVHGCSSASRDWLKKIWDDLEPTMKANLDDYKKAYKELLKEEARKNIELLDLLLEYINTFKRKNDPTFWKWWANKILKKE